MEASQGTPHVARRGLTRRLALFSLPARLVAVVAVLALAMIAVAGLGLWSFDQSEQARAEDTLRVQARALAETVDGPFRNAETALRIEANHPALRADDLKGFETALREATTETGAPYALYDSSSVHLINTAWPPSFRPAGPIPFGPAMQAITTGKLVISDMIRSNASGKLVIPVELPMPEGPDVHRVLGTMLDQSALQGVLSQEQARHEPEWVAYIVDRSGTVVARSQDPEQWVGKPARLRPTDDEGLSRDFERASGTGRVVLAYARAPRSGYLLSVLLPEESFEAPIRTALIRNVALAAMLLFGGLAIATTLAASIVSGLRRMNDRLEIMVRERTVALASSEARLRAFWDNSPEALLLIRVNPGGGTTLIDSNPTHRALIGHDRTLDRAGLRQVFSSEQAARMEAFQARCVAEGVPIRDGGTFDYPTGRRDVEVMLVPLRDEHGTITHLLGSVRDISERNRLQAEMAQGQKMQALGQLAGGIAHDINNVLQAILGSATMIEERPTDAARNPRLARRIIEAATRGSAVTHRLLAFSRRGDLRTSAVDPAAVLVSLRDILSHALGASICVLVEAPEGLPLMRADKAQLETVLINLATNARDAMDSGGTLRFTANTEIVTTERRPARLRPGRYVRIDVADTGFGMDSETLARVTEPFFTTKGVQGTGLGLAMARGFAEQSGGALVIESTPGRGTIVHLWLPVQGEASPGEIEQARGAAGSVEGLRLLLVEDDSLVRETLSLQLEQDGCAVLVASNGEQAISLLRDAIAIDVLVTDLAMPDMDGLQLIRWARALHPRLPCILLTGHTTEAPAESETDVIWMQKPVTLDQLRNALHELRPMAPNLEPGSA